MNRSTRGFSLLEAIIVISLLAICLQMAFPFFGAMIRHAQSEMLKRQLITAIEFAQFAASSEERPIILCATQDKKICAADWSKDWIVFAKRNNKGLVENRRDILRIFSLSFNRGKLFMRSYPRYRNFLLFAPGMEDQNDNSTFWYCDVSHHPQFAIVLNQSGRIRVIEADRSGQLKDGRGKVLACV